VAELSLDHDQRHTFTGHLDRVGVPELMRREAATNTGLERSVAELDADSGWGAWPTAGRATQDAEQRPDRHRCPDLEPRRELLPRPAVHPDLAPLAALSPPDED